MEVSCSSQLYPILFILMNTTNYCSHSDSLSNALSSHEERQRKRSQAASSLALLTLALFRMFETFYVIHSDHDDEGFCLAGLIPRKVGDDFLLPLQEMFRSLVRDDLAFRPFSMTTAVLSGYVEGEGVHIDSNLENVLESSEGGEVLELVEIGSRQFCTLKREKEYVESSSFLKWNELISVECVELPSNHRNRGGKNSHCLIVRGVIATHSKEARKKKKSLADWYNSKAIFKKMSDRGLWSIIEDRHTIEDVLESEEGVKTLLSHRVAYGPDLTKKVLSVPALFHDCVSVWQLPFSPYSAFTTPLRASAIDISVHIFREWTEIFKCGVNTGLNKWLFSSVPLVMQAALASQSFLSTLTTQTALTFYKRLSPKDEFLSFFREGYEKFLKHEIFSKEAWDPASLQVRVVVSPKDSYLRAQFQTKTSDGIIEGVKRILLTKMDGSILLETSSLMRKGEILCVFSVRKMNGLTSIDIQSFMMKIPSSSQERDELGISLCVIPCLSVEKWSALSLFES